MINSLLIGINNFSTDLDELLQQTDSEIIYGDGDSLKLFYDQKDLDKDLIIDINSLENLQNENYWDNDEYLDFSDDELPHQMSREEIHEENLVNEENEFERKKIKKIKKVEEEEHSMEESDGDDTETINHTQTHKQTKLHIMNCFEVKGHKIVMKSNCSDFEKNKIFKNFENMNNGKHYHIHYHYE